MLHFFKLLFFLIDIDQKTVLNWFGVKDPGTFEIEQMLGSGYESNSSSTMEPVSFETVRLIIDGLWYKIQDGLTLADIENVLFYILFIRFLILGIRYNLKTSFYITCIGLFAGYLWYRHLIDLVSMYRNVLLLSSSGATKAPSFFSRRQRFDKKSAAEMQRLTPNILR